MRKRNLFELTAEVRRIILELPIIVGSQAIFSVTEFPPDIVSRSVECDYLLTDKLAEFRIQLTEKLGIFSEYQVKTGYFADVLGLATVVLPPGWEKRMIELKTEDGEVVALCAEVHDVAVSKLMAGRQKDFDFLKTLFESDYLQVETFLKRLEMLVGTPTSAAIEVRVQALTEILEKERNLYKLAARIRTFAKKL